MGVSTCTSDSFLLSSFIVIASSNEYSRKILNSPNYAEPCLVASAKPILLKENWYVLRNASQREESEADSLMSAGSSFMARSTLITEKL